MIAMKCLWEVRAGMIPGEPMQEFTRRWSHTLAELNAPPGPGETTAFTKTMFEVYAYASELQSLSASGRVPNWVTMEYIWL